MIDGDPLGQIVGRGSTRQAPESCWRWCYRGNVSYGAMSLLSHASDGVVEAMALLRQLGCSLMSMPSHAGEYVVEAIWPRCGVGAESCW
jgi:hypothetical protein